MPSSEEGSVDNSILITTIYTDIFMQFHVLNLILPSTAKSG